MDRRALAAFLLIAVPAASPAQTITVHSIDPGAPALGTVVSSANGASVFRISAADGTVVRVSGTAVRLGGGGTRALVAFTCSGGENACFTASQTVTLSAAGSPSGRAGGLSNFTVAPGPNPPSIGAVTSGGSTITFEISGIPAGATRNVYVGADIPIAGDDGGQTGAATSGFSVAVAANSLFGQAEATVIRPINLAKQSDLSFGAILRPSSGTSTVAIGPADGVRSLAGGDGAIIGSGATRAAFSVTGEGGQVISISVPAALALSGPAELEATLESSAGASDLLSALPGSPGSFSFGVGGTIVVGSTTPPGEYVGTFEVMVQYN